MKLVLRALLFLAPTLAAGCVTINVYPNGPGGAVVGAAPVIAPGAVGYAPGPPQTRSIDTTWSPGPTTPAGSPNGAGAAWGPPLTSPDRAHAPGCVAPCGSQGRAIGNDL